MKTNLLTVVISFVVISVVVYVFTGFSAGRRVAPDIEGVYFRFAEHEFGSEWDTLHIQGTGEEGNDYRVTRRWKYERVLDGRTIPPEYKVTATLVHGSEEGRLSEEETGLSYSYDEKDKILMVGTTGYQKIK